MRTETQHPAGPPRLLLGVALLFWGGVTEHPLVGLVCAFLVEARSWTSLRWEFGERGFVRAWYLSFLLGTLTFAWFWLSGGSAIPLFDILAWMPVILLPTLLAQLYASEPTMPLNTFSLIARRKMLIDRAAGRPVDPIRIHVGYPYLCLLLVASGLSQIDQLALFIALMLLMALCLFAASPFSRKRPFGWSFAVVVVAVLGSSVAIGLSALIPFFTGAVSRDGVLGTSPDLTRTAIGQLGDIKLSYRILWRVRDPSLDGPLLFREAAYNRYGQGQWAFRPREWARAELAGQRLAEDEEDAEHSKTYEEMYYDEGERGEKLFAFERSEFDHDPARWRKLTLTGRVQTRSPTPLPLPDSTQRLSRVRALEGGVDHNELGTVRLGNPDQSVVSIEVHYGGPPLSEEEPYLEFDLQVPHGEQPGIAMVVDEWGLRDLPAREAIKVIKERFYRDFQYTTHLDRKYTNHLDRNQPDTGPKFSDAVTSFLTVPDKDGNMAGHCEYFATAAVLLLREAGIPARYCVGFSAQERARRDDEWLLRGRYAHAWVRVAVDGTETEWHDKQRRITRTAWTGGTWIDFDPTPPDWLGVEGSGLPWRTRLLDWWQRLREDFLLWRTNPLNSGRVNWIMGVVSVLLVLYVAIRLWQSKSRTRAEDPAGSAARRRRSNEASRTPLHRLAKPARRWLGARAEAQSFTEWLAPLADLLPATRPHLDRALGYHARARFDPLGLEPAEQQELDRLCNDLKTQLKNARRTEA